MGTRHGSHPGVHAAFRLAFRLLPLCLAFFLGCASLPQDPYTAEQHRLRADGNVLDRNFPAAAAEMELALQHEPENGEFHLRLGELLEAAGEERKALAVYDKARATLSRADSRQQELTYRTALLEIGKFNNAARGRELLAEVPAGSIPRLDLEGLLALGEGDARQALLLFNQALQLGPDKGMAAYLLYHAALAYHHLGDKQNTFLALFRAVNYAENEGLMRDIEAFFRELNEGTQVR